MEAVPHDEYVDEMLAMSLSQTEEIAPPELASPFDLFGVSILEIAGEIQVAPTPEVVEDVVVAVDLFDGPVGPSDTEIVDFGTVDQPRELRIGSDLSTDERDSLIRPVKQKLRRLHPRWSLQVKEEIQKQLSVGFLSVVKYPEWLPMSPKDDFPLPHIDMLVDSTAGHSMLSFMDGFSGYSQILMAPEDMEKTSFITEWGTYCYRVMPFGLKNAGATYQRGSDHTLP
ncbi:Transposon Ty3-I Gag-Pol polyprotein [Vitis vinifera]|uniref:Transposon Ty3-I Gag-Pol polyprotein n=1 Tax=Vitis vinifera TaxID=29760 RepID=A0A438I601_VITVI|nr:Transposon Ty3-I Gag-Pol polyprotein [Vitis vinifera]